MRRCSLLTRSLHPQMSNRSRHLWPNNTSKRKLASNAATANDHFDRLKAQVVAWREELANVDKDLHQKLFSATADKHQANKKPSKGAVIDYKVFGSREMNERVTDVVQKYNHLASTIARSHHCQQQPHEPRQNERITAASLAKPPTKTLSLLNSAQKMLLESFCVRFYALHRVQASRLEGRQMGLDKLAFTTLAEQARLWTQEQLRGTRYGYSTKSAKVKKDLPKKARITPEISSTLMFGAKEFNWKLMANLWPQLTATKLQNSKSVTTIFCQWERCIKFRKKQILQKREVAPLRARVFATMVETAAHPIAEYEADPRSFGWRHRGHRSASMASKYVASRLENYLPMSHKDNPIRFIQVDLDDCFDKMSHETILKSYPLIPQYRSFLQGFLKAPRRGHCKPLEQKELELQEKEKEQENYNKEQSEETVQSSTSTDGTTSWCPLSGVLFDSVLGRSLVSNALDGLEGFLLQDLPLNKDSAPFFEEIEVIRYGASIVIVGMGRYEMFETVSKRLRTFLEERNLYSSKIQQHTEPPIVSFVPGRSFEFLGFRYIFIRKGHPGRFSRGFWNSKRGKFVVPDRFQVAISQTSLNHMNLELQRRLSKRHAPAKVENLIEGCNRALKKISSYFDVSPATHKQLNTYMFKSAEKIRRLFRRKFQSSPQLGTMIRNRFYKKGKEDDGVRIEYNGVRLLKVKEIESGYLNSFRSKAPKTSFLTSNVYLDTDGGEQRPEESPGTFFTPEWIDDALAPKFKLSKVGEDGSDFNNDDEEEDEDRDSGDESSSDDETDENGESENGMLQGHYTARKYE